MFLNQWFELEYDPTGTGRESLRRKFSQSQPEIQPEFGHAGDWGQGLKTSRIVPGYKNDPNPLDIATDSCLKIRDLRMPIGPGDVKTNPEINDSRHF